MQLFTGRHHHHRISKLNAAKSPIKTRRSSPSMDALSDTPSPASSPRPSSRPANFAAREDCWSEAATFTLIAAWGELHLRLNRGNLRQKQWEEVAAAVNARHMVAGKPKSCRTDVQCKNRVDTLKKKYKIEKARVLDSDGSCASPWPFFADLDSFIGSNFPKPSPPLSAPRRRRPPPRRWNFPVAPRSASGKRPAPEPPGGEEQSLDLSAFAAMAAAAAAAAAAEEEERKVKRPRPRPLIRRCGERTERRSRACVELAAAIEKLAETYERVEKRKQRQMVELEIQRMQFSKDLECQRLQLLMETTQPQLRRTRTATKPKSSSPDNYL